jgi:hypothetical protein
VDEYIALWYVQGGHWIAMGLPHYVAIERKAETGCEVQNAACGWRGIMLNIRLEPTAEVETRWTAEIKDGHGTAILSQLVQPWYVAATRDSCVIWYDEISKRRNTAGQTCAADMYRPRRHVPLSPRSSCNRGSPGVITGQAVLNQWVASRTRHLSTFCPRSFHCFHYQQRQSFPGL